MGFATQTKAEEEEPSQSGQNQNGDTVLNRSDTGRDRCQQRQHERRCSENSVPQRKRHPRLRTSENADCHEEPAERSVQK
jgi:hypothetical protein